MAEKKKIKLPITIFELVAYIVTGLLSTWGLVYIILGFITVFSRYDSGLVLADKALKAGANGMGFLEQGILIMVIGVAAAVIVLLSHAKTADRAYEKEQRRKASRFAHKNNEQETVVEVDSTPAE